MRKYMLALLPLFLMTACGSEASSVGIIGGADGPTAVFVAASPSFWPLIFGLALGLIAGILRKRKRK